MTFDVEFMDSDIKYASNQIGYHDSHIDDHDRDLKESMGMMDIIKDEVMKLERMNHCSHCWDFPGEEAQPMEDVSITQPVGFSGKPK